MSQPIIARSMAELESSLGIDPLDELQAELDQSLAQWAKGAALYGPGGLFDDQRKAFLSSVAMRIRTEAREKLTEKWIDDAAHADTEYSRFLHHNQTQRENWLLLNAQRDAITIRVNRGNAVLRATSRWAG